MIFGPTEIYTCPNCNTTITNPSLAMANTFGMQTFSDGKVAYPNKPEFPDLTKCKKCDIFLWLSDLKNTINYSSSYSPTAQQENADKAEFLSITDYFKILETDFITSAKDELIVRNKIWWSFNDRLRANKPLFLDEEETLLWTSNCKKMQQLLDLNNDGQKILIAELERNLGFFNSCQQLITEIDDIDFCWIKEKYLAQCELQNRWVFEL